MRRGFNTLVTMRRDLSTRTKISLVAT